MDKWGRFKKFWFDWNVSMWLIWIVLVVGMVQCTRYIGSDVVQCRTVESRIKKFNGCIESGYCMLTSKEYTDFRSALEKQNRYCSETMEAIRYST